MNMKIRLHSNRMHTTRALTVSPSMLCWGRGCLLLGGVCSRGGVCSGGVCTSEVCLLLGGLLPGGVCSRGCLLQGVSTPGGSALGVCLLWGMSAPGGCIPACTEADIPRWTEFLTHASENITLSKLRLQAVMKLNS